MKPLKLSSEKLLVASDFHAYHDKPFLFEGRGFSSREEHTKFLLASIADLSDDYTMLFLGDLILTASEAEFHELMSCVGFHMYMVWGNHNAHIYPYYKHCIKPFKETLGDGEVYPLTVTNPWNPAGKITFLGNQRSVSVDKQIATLNHFPMKVWDKSHHGTWCLCGHSHNSCADTRWVADNTGKILDCGVEGALEYSSSRNSLDAYPYFQWNHIVDLMKAKSIVKLDHHDSKTT